MVQVDERMILYNGASKSKPITAKISEDAFRKLEEITKASGVTRSAFIRYVLLAVLEFLEEAKCGNGNEARAAEKLVARLKVFC